MVVIKVSSSKFGERTLNPYAPTSGIFNGSASEILKVSAFELLKKTAKNKMNKVLKNDFKMYVFGFMALALTFP